MSFGAVLARGVVCVAAVIAAAGAAAGATGCGASANEIRAAKTSGYQADFSLVYSETLEAVRKLYPQLIENPTAGVIKTAWHPVRLATDQDQTVANNQATNPFGQTTVRRKQYFVRFEVYVVGGNPWRVRVVGQASEWDLGSVPAPLSGAAVPPWLQGRVDALQVEVYRRLKQFAVELKSTAAAGGAAAVIEAEIDESKLGDLPAGASEVAGEVVRAAKSRDFERLRKSMHPEFTWSLGAAPGVDAALAMWQADSRALEALAAIIEAGCGAQEDGQRVMCPREAIANPDFQGSRAEFAKAADGKWKMTAFVEGD